MQQAFGASGAIGELQPDYRGTPRVANPVGNSLRGSGLRQSKSGRRCKGKACTETQKLSPRNAGAFQTRLNRLQLRVGCVAVHRTRFRAHRRRLSFESITPDVFVERKKT
jgi:hypothetical protein